MNKLIVELRSQGAHFILVIIQIQNWIALTVGGLVLGLHEMFPTAVSDFTATMSPIKKFGLLALWAGLVHFFTRQAKKTI
jgi:hypothetical protein